MEKKRFCFLIPVLNAQRTIAETLESLLSTGSSRVSSEADIVLLDGGSCDATQAIVQNLAQKYSRIKWHVLPGSHPAERINSTIDDGIYDVAMMCHADDIYSADLRVEVAEEMLALSHWLRGSMHGYFQDPMSAIIEGRTEPYTGKHLAYPKSPESVWAELPLWWSISLNTVALDLKSIRHSGIRYDWKTYKYCADYWFSWQLARSKKASNSDLVTTITRHDNLGDGPTNATSLRIESLDIRRLITEDIGIASRIRPEILQLLLEVQYSYGTVTPPAWATASDLNELTRALAVFYEDRQTKAPASSVLAGFTQCQIQLEATDK
jgi:hypothetical protein